MRKNCCSNLKINYDITKKEISFKNTCYIGEFDSSTKYFFISNYSFCILLKYYRIKRNLLYNTMI